MFENNALVLLYMLLIRGRKLNQLLGNQDTMGSPNAWFTRSRNSVKVSVTLVDRRRSVLYTDCMTFDLVSRSQTRYGVIISQQLHRFVQITKRPCGTTLHSLMFLKSEKNLIVSAFTSLFYMHFYHSLFNFLRPIVSFVCLVSLSLCYCLFLSLYLTCILFHPCCCLFNPLTLSPIITTY